MNRLKCNSCIRIATWLYMPRDEIQYCDLHVPRGCSCNIDPDTQIKDIDKNGQLLPCCEFHYNENGFDE